MARYIDAKKITEHKFASVTHDRYVSDGRQKSEEEIYAYKVGYNDAIDSIAQFTPTADEEKIATEYCMKHGLVMITMDSYETLMTYYDRSNGFYYKEERKEDENNNQI